MDTPAGRHAAADADVPVQPSPRPRRPSPDATSATRRHASTTSTRTGSPTGSSSTPRQLDARRASRPARWARPGATGTPWTTWSRPGPRRADTPDKVDVVHGFYVRRAALPRPHRGPIDCTAAPASTAECPGAADRPAAATRTATTARSSAPPEVHADGEIWAQTLWDLRDALGRARTTESLVDAGDGALRRPTRRSSTCATRSCRPTSPSTRRPTRTGDLEGLRPPRHGLLRRLARRQRQPSQAGLHQASELQPDRLRDAHRVVRGAEGGHRSPTRRSR